MEISKMTDIVIEHIKKNGKINFIEIEKLFINNGFDYKGDMIFGLSNEANIPATIYWNGWNKAAYEVLQKLRAANIQQYETSASEYYAYITEAELPFYDELRRYPDTLKWLPVAFR